MAVAIIALAQGYRWDHSTNTVYGTGIIEVETSPTGATVKLNGQNKGTTNTTISNLAAGEYTVEVTKDGYAEWKTTVDLKAGKVVSLLPLLVPINPSLSPVSSTPALRPVQSPDGQKLAFVVPDGSSAGIWVMELSSQPFNFSRKPQQIIADTAVIPYSQATLTWAPNNRELLATLDNGLSSNSYLLAVDGSHPPQDVSGTISDLQTSWQTEREQALQEITSDMPEKDQQMALAHADNLQWAPSGLKFLYVDETEDKRIYSVYNKETQESHVSMEAPKDTFVVIRWYADGQHLIVLEKKSAEAIEGTVSLMETDGSNKVPAFSGTLIGDVLYSLLNGTKLIILTSFNQQSDSYYLYSINLR